MIPHSTISLTDAELRRQFEWALAEAQQGRGRTDLSLDDQVQEALLEIMDATPSVPPELIDKARSVFADQLAGAVGPSRQDELLALLKQSRRSA
ncbi:hypothetical protein ACFO5K_04580 [Nocardia halotolerans]|uniref:Uncharacterized protein n=1 Tax=Nocardia halotolerans TaxID=1755878 RepID=A0ABV8VEW0_9NOCA